MNRSRGTRLRRAALLACLAPIAGFAAVPAGAPAKHPPTDCRSEKCYRLLKLKPSGKVKWRSKQTFYAYNEQILARFVADRRQAEHVRSWGEGSCRHLFRSTGVRKIKIRAKACGSASPLHVWAQGPKRGKRKAAKKPIRIKVVYTASPRPGGEGPGAGPGDDLLTLFTPITGLLFP